MRTGSSAANAGVGITARALGYRVHEEMIPREMLYIADEIFFTGTAAEVTPIRELDGRVIGGGGIAHAALDLRGPGAAKKNRGAAPHLARIGLTDEFFPVEYTRDVYFSAIFTIIVTFEFSWACLTAV